MTVLELKFISVNVTYLPPPAPLSLSTPPGDHLVTWLLYLCSRRKRTQILFDRLISVSFCLRSIFPRLFFRELRRTCRCNNFGVANNVAARDANQRISNARRRAHCEQEKLHGGEHGNRFIKQAWQFQPLNYFSTQLHHRVPYTLRVTSRCYRPFSRVFSFFLFFPFFFCTFAVKMLHIAALRKPICKQPHCERKTGDSLSVIRVFLVIIRNRDELANFNIILK